MKCLEYMLRPVKVRHLVFINVQLSTQILTTLELKETSVSKSCQQISRSRAEHRQYCSVHRNCISCWADLILVQCSVNIDITRRATLTIPQVPMEGDAWTAMEPLKL